MTRWFTHIEFSQGYGLSETAGAVTVLGSQDHRRGGTVVDSAVPSGTGALQMPDVGTRRRRAAAHRHRPSAPTNSGAVGDQAANPPAGEERFFAVAGKRVARLSR